MLNKKNKKAELDGRMTAESTDINSIQYKDSMGILLERFQNRTTEEQIFIEMTGIKVRMKKYLEDSSINKKRLRTVQDFYREMLNTSHVSQNQLAEYIGYRPNNLSIMFKSEKVNYEIAKILESIFHIDCTLWLDIQIKNQRIVNAKNQKTSFDSYSYNGLIG